VHFVIGEFGDVNSCTACILQNTVNRATQPNLHLRLMQDLASETVGFRNKDYWSVRKDSQTENCVKTASCVRACSQSGPQKSTLRCGFMYNCVQIARSTTVLVSVFVEWGTE